MRLWMLGVELVLATACIGESKDDTPCTERAADECGGCQTIEARELVLVEDTAACYDTGASEVVGCMDTGGGCTAAITYARPSEDADCMWFSSGCTPDGWTYCEIDVCY